MRWRADLTSPTSSVGSLLRDGSSFVLRGESNVLNIQFIRTGSTDATVSGAFFSDIEDAVAYMVGLPVTTAATDDAEADTTDRVNTTALLYGQAPDGDNDRIYTLGNTTLLGLGQLAAAPWVPGASAVASDRKLTASASTTRATLMTPAGGKKVRVISVQCMSITATGTIFEVYFGTGANIGTNAGKSIYEGLLDLTDAPNGGMSWPDGGGPVGAADDIISVRTSGDITNNGYITVQTREE